MAVDPAAFGRYWRSPNEKTTLLRLFLGTLLIAAVWLGTTVAVLFAGFYAREKFGPLFGSEVLTFSGDPLENFMTSRVGFVASLLTFAGIWIGVWAAMRLLHRERLSRLLGNSARISWSGFLNGLIAVLLTSVLSELCIYVMLPELAPGSISVPVWLLFLLPALFLGFVQTSAEELLFRGYLLRGLAYRFRSPWVWAFLPTLVFTTLHWNTAVPLTMNVAVFVSIGAFAAMLVLLVYATGNLGAAMGAHLGNNATGFLLVSHDNSLASFALLKGAPLGSLASTISETAVIVAISIVSVLLTVLLLMHPRSPLKVKVDLDHDREAPQPNLQQT